MGFGGGGRERGGARLAGKTELGWVLASDRSKLSEARVTDGAVASVTKKKVCNAGDASGPASKARTKIPFHLQHSSPLRPAAPLPSELGVANVPAASGRLQATIC